MTDPVVSHGRGGTGNIRPDSTPYTDGEIVREGPISHTTEGIFSTGRGGQGNISSPGLKPATIHTDSQEVIPEAAMRPSMEERNYHIGRGGEGNAYIGHHDKDKAKEKPVEKDASTNHGQKEHGFVDKLRDKVLGHPKTSDEDAGVVDTKYN